MSSTLAYVSSSSFTDVFRAKNCLSEAGAAEALTAETYNLKV
jgi:hypothetical protein